MLVVKGRGNQDGKVLTFMKFTYDIFLRKPVEGLGTLHLISSLIDVCVWGGIRNGAEI